MSGSQDKPRVRVPARSSATTDAGYLTTDTFQNWAANLGYGTNNLTSASSYGFNPISRNRQLLEWMYRGSWLVRKVVDCPSDDMTREGIQVESEMPPDEIDELNEYWTNFELWHRLNLTLKWARLYGGAVAAIIIDGQDPSTELRLDSIRKGQFAGLIVLDRWMLWPHQELVKAPGRNFGKPAMYEVVADARAIPRMRIHHSRCIRFDGADLPYWQRMAENEWSLSVIEPMWDRMIAFDSATQGAAQLIYKAHLRVLKLPQYRELIATGGTMLGAVHQMISMIRMMQTNEGMTVIDAEDEYQVNSYAFGGLSDMMIQFGQQVSGASDVPMTRLFGQSPAGMNATGESDLRNYYDGIKSRQEFGLRPIIKQLLDITHRSLRGRPLPAGFNFSFKPLWQMQEVEKAGIAAQTAQTISTYIESGVFTLPIAMKEVRQSSRITGLGSNLTDEDIEQAEMAPPTPPGGIEAEGGGVPGEPPSPPVAGQPGGQPEAEQPVPTPQLTPHQPARPQDGALGEPGGILDLSRHRAMRRLAHEGNAADDVPPAKSNAAITQANVNLGTGVHARANLPEGVVVNFVPDRRSITDIGGLQCVVETAKGEQRTGYGWSVNMPAHYGYISGTSSAEGPTEQFDCFIGDNPQAEKCWLIEQQDPDTKLFDEHKAMLGFNDRKEALAAYVAAFDDGRGRERVKTVREMSVDAFKSYLDRRWKYGQTAS